MLSRTLRQSLASARRAAVAPVARTTVRGVAGHDVPKVQNVSETNKAPTRDPSMGEDISEGLVEGEKARSLQAPNRSTTWSNSQQAREIAMSGPRFEHTIFELQPAPQAAIELIHKQPVRWTHERMVSCDGGGGPLGHPRVYINVDKPQICTCGYCGLPFANEHHREFLQSLPETPYPLEPQQNAHEVPDHTGITDHPFEQR